MGNAAHEFELIDAKYSRCTQKLASRSDFLAPSDFRGYEDGDFIGRLIALFGSTSDGEYVLRHLPTGLIITAYSGSYGPSFGGGYRFGEELPDEPIFILDSEFRIKHADEIERLKKKGNEVYQAWMQKQIDEFRADRKPHPEYMNALKKLNTLMDSVVPADWQTIRYFGNTNGVYKIGFKDGVSIEEKLPQEEGFKFLLSEAEKLSQSSAEERDLFDEAILDYWDFLKVTGEVHLSQETLARVRKSWFRRAELIPTLAPISSFVAEATAPESVAAAAVRASLIQKSLKANKGWRRYLIKKLKNLADSLEIHPRDAQAALAKSKI